MGIAPRRERPRRRVLVIALDSIPVPSIDAGAEVLVVAPALNSWLKRWLSDEDGARRKATDRLASFTAGLSRVGVCIEGRVGDADPLQAISDALRTFRADEIVIAGEPQRPSRLTEALVSRALNSFGLPVSVGRKPVLQAA